MIYHVFTIARPAALGESLETLLISAEALAECDGRVTDFIARPDGCSITAEGVIEIDFDGYLPDCLEG